MSYSSTRTKTAAIAYGAFGTNCHDFIVQHCQNYPYSCSTGGSNDTGIQKMNPVSIRIYDANTSKVVSNHFCNMYLTEGEHRPAAESIFATIENNFDWDNIPVQNCVSLSADNASTMIWKRNSLASDFKDKNSEIFISLCFSSMCHLAYIAASHANDAFSEVLGLNVENSCIDIFYWFDKSSKRKGKLIEYFQFCDQEYQSVLKHVSLRWLSLGKYMNRILVSVRWLSLEKCMNRILKKIESLKSYFLGEEWTDERFQRLHRWFSNPLLEQALMFQTNAISMFTNFNLLLQRDQPSKHVLKAAIESLGRKLSSRIVTPTHLCNSTSAFSLDLHDDQLCKQHTSIFLEQELS